jgi:hypothetical protein
MVLLKICVVESGVFSNKRAKYIRYRLYAIAAKVIKTGRKVIIKCQAQYYQLLTKVLNDIKAFKHPNQPTIKTKKMHPIQTLPSAKHRHFL